MPPRVFATRRIPQSGLKLLQEATDLLVFEEDRMPTREEIRDGLQGREGLVSLLTDSIDGELMNAGDLRVISNYAVGVDNIDVLAATRRGIMVTNTPVDGLRESPADHTFALILALSRRIVEGDRLVRQGSFTGWGPEVLLGTDVYGKTLGIVGAGGIGAAVATRAAGFGMQILYHSRAPKEEWEAGLGAQFVPLPQLLREADVVTLHVPLSAKTKHLIGATELQMMKESAFLINASRGPVVDEEALVAALKAGRVAGAALDVFEHEPEVHPGLRAMSNVVLTPHTASATWETRSEMAVVAAENLLAGLRGEVPPFLVNPEVLSSQD
ncbi:MAG: D-glycerate dehydrogenase [Candidatus Thermoplasmatota archaeon]|nr:D-glycerate dehydrogenase [Candidatus Thermoplasmatota archaeon]